ncbi:MAG: glycine--tRNA ligase subunit beta [Deltaproteobacteria bacterium]|nr:MAG: glycine--tRNA ligase subunit beta [Deltaproteobacteria bacterium]
MHDLLFEIGTEEIPAGYLQPAYEQLRERFQHKAKELRIDHGPSRVMGTPRRLVLIVEGLAPRQQDIREELVGPSQAAGIDADGNYTRAAEGFARSKGSQPEDLQVTTTPKGEYLCLVREVKGQETRLLLGKLLAEIIKELSFPKSMRWADKHLAFARPIQWLLAIYNGEKVAVHHEGIEASNRTRGHRFHANTSLEVDSLAQYFALLKEADVLVDPVERRAAVVVEINKALAENASLAGGSVMVDEGLVDTITNLVENPVGVCGNFDSKFLQLAPEVLITSMRVNQKYFPVVDAKGRLMPGFVAVNNTRVKHPETTRAGHERVLRARLEDALFFYNSDRQTPLADRVEGLDGIIFQARLGTMAEKKERLVKLGRLLAELIEPAASEAVCRAALLCKCDLLTDMVAEFPSLQGVMGAAYAENDGEEGPVVLAIKEHYKPKRAGAAVPESTPGAILALADRFDSLVGCFGIGFIPTGTADPFALRRTTLAILHIIEEKGYHFSLREIVVKALALYGDKVDGGEATVEQILDFIKERFRNDRLARGVVAGAVEAVLASSFDDVNACQKRLAALVELHGEPSFAVLSAAYKRIRNIAGKNQEDTIDQTLLIDDAEKELFALYTQIEKEVVEQTSSGAYLEALQLLLQMKEPVDRFFDEVMVMADDPAIRQNRLNLLTALGNLILLVGDISKF